MMPRPLLSAKEKQHRAKIVCCPICQQQFSRPTHLQRHQIRHLGIRPFQCEFCEGTFSRSDNLRSHYLTCPQRGDEEIPTVNPNSSQAGRKRHACGQCVASKLRCDGKRPCDSCQKRALTCQSHQRIDTGEEEQQDPTNPTHSNQMSDQILIKFLLNGGTDSFTESFRLPPSCDRIRGMAYHIQKRSEDADELDVNFLGHSNVLFSFDETNNTDFFDVNPIDDPPRAMEVLSESFPSDPIIGRYHEDTNVENKSTLLIQRLYKHAQTFNFDTDIQQTMYSNLHYLLVGSRIRRFVDMYFKYWHCNLQLIHQPSFDLDSVPTALLIAIIFVGAIYSNDENEVSAARQLLDIAEFSVFYAETFTGEISGSFNHKWSVERSSGFQSHFENLQAGVIMVIAQYWAGSRSSRNRVMETRFGEITRVAQNLRLTHCRHSPEDLVHESLWIRKEAHIRTMNVVVLLDCAFLFFQNYPCRLAIPVLGCDLPCEDAVFSAEHPFAQPRFRFSREITVYEAFRHLFSTEATTTGSGISAGQEKVSGSVSSGQKEFIPTFLDMFILIHDENNREDLVLHAFIHSHILLCIPLIDSRPFSQASNRSDTTDHGRFKSSILLSDKSIQVAIRKALQTWRILWTALEASITQDEWCSLGFYKYSYNFWLVAQLLVSKEDTFKVVTQLEGQCDDKLQWLNDLVDGTHN